jgi:hypothetical protein
MSALPRLAMNREPYRWLGVLRALFELSLMVCVGTVGSGSIAGTLRAGPMALL